MEFCVRMAVYLLDYVDFVITSIVWSMHVGAVAKPPLRKPPLVSAWEQRDREVWCRSGPLGRELAEPGLILCISIINISITMITIPGIIITSIIMMFIIVIISISSSISCVITIMLWIATGGWDAEVPSG